MHPSTADIEVDPAYRKSAGEETLPGYVLIEPLGRGGFGEVWKCEAPGGLHKAIKFVPGASSSDSASTHQFNQEFDAFLQIKTIRHPFLLTLERVELIGGDLVMVMELADRQMRDRYDECRAEGLPGIPRDELIGYLGEAAEALDLINSKYGLQHLDVKPANLFITSGHVKVGDYGLVSRLDGTMDDGTARGLTPKYVAPEVLRGLVDPRSDQYSLALVYQEMLTGTFPYSGRNPQQMMLAHVSAAPNLAPLPECDRAPVGTALAKNPEERFDSCQDFMHELFAASHTVPGAKTGKRTSGVTPYSRHRTIETTPGPAERTGRHATPASGTIPASGRSRPSDPTKGANDTLPPLSTVSQSPPERALPPLPPAMSPPPVKPPIQPARPTPPSPRESDLPFADSDVGRRVRVTPIRSVVPVGRLHGQSVPDAVPNARDFAVALVARAAGNNQVPQIPGDLGRLANGGWISQFPTTVPEAFAPLKLTVLRDQWSLTMAPPENGTIIFRKSASGGFWSALSSKRAGLELTVKLPATGKTIGEVTVIGQVYGEPDRTFLQAAQTAIPKLIEEVRRELGNVSDRRKSPRLAADFPMTVHPLHSDGTVDPSIPGRCRDISAGGVCFTTVDSITTRYAYLEFGGGAANAVLVKLIRSQPLGPGGSHVYAGPFRLDL